MKCIAGAKVTLSCEISGYYKSDSKQKTCKQRHPEGQYCSKYLKIFQTFDKWGQSWVKNKRGWAGFHFLPYMEAYIWHVAAGNIDKELLAKVIHSVINRKELDEGTKLEVIHAMEKSPLFSEDGE